MLSDFAAKSLTSVALVGSILIFPMVASAQVPLSGNLNVQITIKEECSLGAISGINFGNTGLITQNIDETGTIQVTCTKGTDYKLELSAGEGAGASMASRLMTRNGSSDAVSYSLYRDAGHAELWGSETDALSGTGTGAVETLDVFGRVPPQNTPEAGIYQDIVTVTLAY